MASPLGWVTVSVGVASLVPQPDMQAKALLILADQALHQAKQAGRNRVGLAGEAAPAAHGLAAAGGQVWNRRAGRERIIKLLLLCVDQSDAGTERLQVRIRLLVSADALTSENRWALVSALFNQGGSSLASTIGVMATIFICWQRTGWSGFLWLAAYGAAAIGVTVWLSHFYHRRRRSTGTGIPTGSPELWALRFVLRTCVLASTWSLLDVVVFTLFTDAGLQFFVVSIGAGWLAGAAARNAVSPASVMLPMAVVLVPQGIAAALASDHFARVLVPFLPVLFFAMESIARHIGQQTVKSMLAELRLASLNEQLVGLSTTDGLTGIANRRCFDAALETAWAAARRDASSLALLMLDVDYFKRYNDQYGHLQGDDCLRTVAMRARLVMQRPADLIARYGGEEFIALLPDTDAQGAWEVADRLRLAVHESRIPHIASPLGWVTVSVGVASLVPQPDMQAKDLLALADQALYQAKQAGRNGVGLAGASAPWAGGTIDADLAVPALRRVG